MNRETDFDCPPLALDDNQTDDALLPIEGIQFSIWHTFKHHIPRFLVTILVDLIMPVIVYSVLQNRIPPVYALLAAGIPPFIMIVIKGIVSQTFDALGFLVLIGFIASAIAGIITKNPTFILLEKSIVTGVISIIFGITLIPCHCSGCYRCHIRPLAYYFYKDFVPTKRSQVGLPDILFSSEQEMIDDQFLLTHEKDLLPQLSHKQEVNQVYEWIYAHCSSFRLSCYLITGIWSVGLLFEFLARLFLILIGLSTQKIFIYGHIILSSMTTILIVLTAICIMKERKMTLKSIQKWKKQYLHIQQDHSFVASSTTATNSDIAL